MRFLLIFSIITLCSCQRGVEGKYIFESDNEEVELILLNDGNYKYSYQLLETTAGEGMMRMAGGYYSLKRDSIILIETGQGMDWENLYGDYELTIVCHRVDEGILYENKILRKDE